MAERSCPQSSRTLLNRAPLTGRSSADHSRGRPLTGNVTVPDRGAHFRFRTTTGAPPPAQASGGPGDLTCFDHRSRRLAADPSPVRRGCLAACATCTGRRTGGSAHRASRTSRVRSRRRGSGSAGTLPNPTCVRLRRRLLILADGGAFGDSRAHRMASVAPTERPAVQLGP